MSDKDLIERLWREAAYVKPLSKGAYEALTDAADALESVRAERDAALELMNQHKCGENVEAAYRRAVDAEARIAAADAVCCKHLKCPGGSLCCCRNDAMVTVEQIAEVIMRALVFTNENSKPWADGVARDVRALFGKAAGDETLA